MLLVNSVGFSWNSEMNDSSSKLKECESFSWLETSLSDDSQSIYVYECICFMKVPLVTNSMRPRAKSSKSKVFIAFFMNAKLINRNK